MTPLTVLSVMNQILPLGFVAGVRSGNGVGVGPPGRSGVGQGVGRQVGVTVGMIVGGGGTGVALDGVNPGNGGVGGSG